MLGIMDYFIIGYMVILCLISAYLRRNSDNKSRISLSYAFLMCACLSIIGYFILFYYANNHEKYLIYFLVVSLLILAITIIINKCIFNKKIKENDEDEK